MKSEMVNGNNSNLFFDTVNFVIILVIKSACCIGNQDKKKAQNQSILPSQCQHPKRALYVYLDELAIIESIAAGQMIYHMWNMCFCTY